MPVAFYWMDKDGYCLGCNEEELSILGLDTMDQFIGKHSSELFELQAWLNSKEVIEKKLTQQFDEYCSLKNGTIKYFFTIKTPIFDEVEKDKVIALIGVSIDFTKHFIKQKQR